MSLFDVAVLFLVVAVAVTLAYYLRPSRGAHGNPTGAATTVASLRASAEHDRANLRRSMGPVGDRYSLLCGHDLVPRELVAA
ncbi:MAG TPA: hypothetical protein VM677_18575 [Actinokineospora sp.]|jgi:hypothetical protein|nr:hypothetical protein [Actinokineospora sp.]